MRIGMVTACYKPVINGVTRMIAQYKEQLEARGHEVTVFTLGDPDPAGDEPGVVRSPAISLGDTGYYITMRYTRSAQKLLEKMDILHCHHLFMSVEMAHRYSRCPIVYTNHTRYDLYTGSYVSLPQPTADAIMRQVWPEFTDLADVVITPSESVRQVMLDFGVSKPIEVIENGIALRPFFEPKAPHQKRDFGIPDTATLLIYVGRISAEKNINILLQQFAVARLLLPDLHLMVVGDGPGMAEMKQLAAALDIAQSVHFTGAIAYEELPDLLAAADMFVTASVSEVHPLTVIEAMASGLPIAATASAGISDTVVPGKTGLLTPDPETGLAATITALAFNPDRRREMGAAAIEDSRRYDIKRTIDLTLALYARLGRERPDLQREKEHGRWSKRNERLQPLVDQLADMVRSPWRLNAASLRLLLTGESDPDDGP